MPYAALTDTGLIRANNEDSLYASDRSVGILSNLFMVADGMGGHKGGEIASLFVVEEIIKFIKKKRRRRPIPTLLSEAADRVNLGLFDKAEKEPELKGMGTTLVLATIQDGTMYVMNIGDSRLYYYEDGKLSQVTRDHSMVDEMVAAGKLTKDDPFYKAHKNVITRAIGGAITVEEEQFEMDPAPGSRVLLCSDGLSGMTPDEEIAAILGEGLSPEETVKKLIETSKSHGGEDNISAIVIDVDEKLLKGDGTC